MVEMKGNKPINGVLIDLGGVVYVGDRAIAGSLAALQRLTDAAIPKRFITNTTSTTKAALVRKLAAMGLDIASDELTTPSEIARTYLRRHSLTPYLVVRRTLEEEFADLPRDHPFAVVIGDVGPDLDYARLNTAYRHLNDGAPLLALARNRIFLDDDGKPSLDAGPFVAALEYASQKSAIVLGKPAETFFSIAVTSMGCRAENVVMIGDDAEADVGGAIAAGLQGILVRTGKYRAGDDQRIAGTVGYVADDLAAAVDHVLQHAKGPI